MDAVKSMEDRSSCSKRLWERFFILKKSDYVGILKSKDDVDELIKEFELETWSRFVQTRGLYHNYGKEFDANITFTIRWKDGKTLFNQPYISFDGDPFVIMGRKLMSCHHGPWQQKPKPVTTAVDQVHDYENSSTQTNKKKRRRKSQGTKKLGCPATITIRHIVKFPDYKIKDDTVCKRRATSKKLNEDIKAGKKVQKVHCYIIELPQHHENHTTGENSGRAFHIDPQLSRYLHELVQAKKVFSCTEAKELLGQYLELEMFRGKSLPMKTNRRYWPSSAVIRAHMASSKLPAVKRDKSVSACKLRAKTKEKIRKLERYWHNIADDDEKEMAILDEKLTKTLESLKKKDEKAAIIPTSPPVPKNKVYAAAAAYAASEIVTSCPPPLPPPPPVPKNKMYAAAAVYAASEIEGARGCWASYYPGQGHPGCLQ